MHAALPTGFVCALALLPGSVVAQTITRTYFVDSSQSTGLVRIGLFQPPSFDAQSFTPSGAFDIEMTTTAGQVTSARILAADLPLPSFAGTAVSPFIGTVPIPYTFQGGLGGQSVTASPQRPETFPVAPGGAFQAALEWTMTPGSAIGGPRAVGLAGLSDVVFSDFEARLDPRTMRIELAGEWNVMSGFDAARVNVDCSLVLQTDPQTADAFPGRRGCPASYVWTPQPGGGYAVTAGGSVDDAFDSPGASALPHLSPVAIPVELGFPFTMPGGEVVTTLAVDQHGRLAAPAGFSSTPLDFTADLGELFFGRPQIAPLWHAMDADTGSLWFHTGPGFASVTWRGAPQLLPGTNHEISYQVVLRDDDSFEFHYLDVADLVNSFIVGSSQIVVGIGSGTGVVPTLTDLSEFPTALGPSAAQAFSVVQDFDLFGRFEDVQLVPVTMPVLGTDFVVEVEATGQASSATGAVVLFGLPTGLALPALPLDLFGGALTRCEVLVDIASPGFLLTSVAAPVNAPVVLSPISPSPVFLGVEGLVAQALVIDPTSPQLFVPTSELVLRFGR